eukprot:CAMPEP_0183394820 /NCGR_PEP_ID=MMETSP0370-20130417/8860_1 /TAXON_ID=268820 /ORGANISM="Peridinium aciculiferum, Strain PAER-2" /LENGTH=52 /DNA_ID=CAMNT_0025575297 /DNA_START=49 /DNA_END=203 /DNA_ORIENTATION=+
MSGIWHEPWRPESSMRHAQNAEHLSQPKLGGARATAPPQSSEALPVHDRGAG